jgi:beta-N-acetylhexosaminidase
MSHPLAVIYGCDGTVLSDQEKAFFRDADPLGFILFARNIDTPDQVRALTRDLRDSIGREDAPILIDQEGGRVQRLRPPHWRDAPSPGTFADLHNINPDAGLEAATLNARLIASDLHDLGVDVDCLPVLDVPQADSHPFLKGRAAGNDADQAAILGRAACDGLLAGGVMPVIKHIPGHGRATADSHHDLPRVDVSAEQLDQVDFAPFRALADIPWAMTAHIVYAAFDNDQPASTSSHVIETVIRDSIGFEGFLVSDDIGMNALSGTIPERVQACLTAGSDAVLHCNDLDEREAVATVASTMSDQSMARFQTGRAQLSKPHALDKQAALDRLGQLLAEI